MTGFWLMFLLPLWAVLAPWRLPARQSLLSWWAIGLLFALMIGLRHEVGGDWFNYAHHFEHTAAMPLREALSQGDPGYYGLNWLMARLGGDVYWVNLVCACVVMWGTVVFCRRQPWPWLALLVAVPYLLVVVAMGYSRQAVALGLALLGLVALGESRIRSFLFWIGIAATFHKSAVLLLPIAALAASRNRLFSLLMVGTIAAALYYLLLADASEALWENYVVAQYQSDGGMIRVLMNVVPAVLMLLWGRHLAPDPQQRRLWIWISLLAITCLPLVLLASTAVDRVALYLIPLQLFVFARLPLLAGKNVRTRTLLVLSVIAYYAAVEFVWLNFATHARYWLPYQFKPFV